METNAIIRAAGGPLKVARALGRHHSGVVRWKRVPAEHARAVARMAGVNPHDVRPDLYDAPADRPTAEVDSTPALGAAEPTPLMRSARRADLEQGGRPGRSPIEQPEDAA